jgi:hypothetical protein
LSRVACWVAGHWRALRALDVAGVRHFFAVLFLLRQQRPRS